jgi:hypothetical protein
LARHSPNVEKLILRKVAHDTIPTGKGLIAAVEFISDRERLAKAAAEASEWAMRMIQSVRDAEEPNIWKRATDEEIAGEIMRMVERRTDGYSAKA